MIFNQSKIIIPVTKTPIVCTKYTNIVKIINPIHSLYCARISLVIEHHELLIIKFIILDVFTFKAMINYFFWFIKLVEIVKQQKQFLKLLMVYNLYIMIEVCILGNYAIYKVKMILINTLSLMYTSCLVCIFATTRLSFYAIVIVYITTNAYTIRRRLIINITVKSY